MFNLYPKINFKVNDYDIVRAIDLSFTFKVGEQLKSYKGISYYSYTIQDGERPDSVSTKFYNTPNFDWIILLVNNMYNVYEDWPKDTLTLERYIIEKYGSISNANTTVKYYYDADGDIIDSRTYNALPASQRSLETALQYENRINILKSRIRIAPINVANKIFNDLNNLSLVPVV
jgi:hypothetical protein